VLQIEGFSDVLLTVIRAVLPQILSPPIKSHRVATALAMFARSLRNSRKGQPYRRALYWGGGVLLGSKRFSDEQLFSAVTGLAGDVGQTLDSDSPLSILSPSAVTEAVVVSDHS
jgi:hypothetical protein